MLNTKLIFVDGITGSGKSTTAHFIARQLEKNGIKAKWFHEQEIGHPLSYWNMAPINNAQDHLKVALEFTPQLLKELADKIASDDTVYIIESYLFLQILEPFISNNTDRETIESFYKEYFSIITALNPTVIHLYQENTQKALDLACARRGGETMKQWYIDVIVSECNLFCKTRNLTGEEAVVKYLAEENDIGKKLFNKFTCNKLQIETSEQNWQSYRRQITDFLGLTVTDEELQDKYLSDFCGVYHNESEIIERTIYLKDGKLFYFRGENNESNLSPIDSHTLAFERSCTRLVFDFTRDIKHFRLIEQGQGDLVFVQVIS